VQTLFYFLTNKFYSSTVFVEFFIFLWENTTTIINSNKKHNKEMQHPTQKKKKAGIKSFSLKADFFPFSFASALQGLSFAVGFDRT